MAKIKAWGPKDFELETNTVWSFPDRGKWATHDAKWRGNWSPYIPRNVILRYSQEGELVLDQFAGGGTTLVEAKLLNRNIIGIDVNDVALERCADKVNFEHEGADGKVFIRKGDARALSFIPDKSIDLICTHPPYANIIQYSEDLENDLSHCNVDAFLAEMEKVASESYRVLKAGKFCVVLMGDTRQKGHVIPLSFNVMKVFEAAGFKPKEIIIKEQHNCKATGFWKTNSIKYNFLLLAHEYLLVFHKQPSKAKTEAFVTEKLILNLTLDNWFASELDTDKECSYGEWKVRKTGVIITLLFKNETRASASVEELKDDAKRNRWIEQNVIE